jgi:hypothetical protein
VCRRCARGSDEVHRLDWCCADAGLRAEGEHRCSELPLGRARSLRALAGLEGGPIAWSTAIIDGPQRSRSQVSRFWLSQIIPRGADARGVRTRTQC